MVRFWRKSLTMLSQISLVPWMELLDFVMVKDLLSPWIQRSPWSGLRGNLLALKSENYKYSSRFQGQNKRAASIGDVMPQFVQNLNGAERLRFGWSKFVSKICGNYFWKLLDFQSGTQIKSELLYVWMCSYWYWSI